MPRAALPGLSTDPANPDTWGGWYNAVVNELSDRIDAVTAYDAPFLAAGAPAGAERTLAARASDTVSLDDFWLPADASNWSLTLARALTYAIAQAKAVRLNRIYPYSTTVVLPSNSTIVGAGPNTGFAGPVDAPVKLFSILSGGNIHLTNFLLDGAITAAVSAGNTTRGMQFEDATAIRLDRMFVKNCADWAVSFKRCTDVTVTRHTHTGGGLTTPGGRDAIHILDCSNVLIDGAVIDSGDDCVGITSETVGNTDITVRNISGASDIGSVVIFNEEGATTFPMTNLTISGIRTRNTVRDIVRVYTVNTGTIITGVKISDVKGTSSLHAIYLGGNSTQYVSDVSVSDVDVKSTSQHGIYLNKVRSFNLAGAGKSVAGAFSGINVSNCLNGYVKPRSRGSSLWGCHVYNSTDITVDTPILIDCGIGEAYFAGNTGGAMRVEGSTDVSIIDGTLSGDPTISYRSLSTASNTRFRMTPTTRLAAQVTTTPPTLPATDLDIAGVGAALGISAPHLATTDPLVTSDTAAGYSPGSVWVNTATATLFTCLSAGAGVAVWQRSTANVQTFTANGTWTKPAWAQTVTALVVGNGGGGGSGAQTASGTACSGGGGGGGAGMSMRVMAAALCGSTETVTVSGTVGTGGAAQATTSTAGTAGVAGGANSFGSHVKTGGGAAGQGGGIAGGATAGAGGGGQNGGGTGGAGANGAVGTAAAAASACVGGSGGGGVSVTPASFAGATGATSNQAAYSGGSSGAVNSAGGAGTSAPAGEAAPGGSGGGGGASITAAGGAGGAGGAYGAGGGGGGASLNGFSSGAGGAGATGIVVVVTD